MFRRYVRVALLYALACAFTQACAQRPPANPGRLEVLAHLKLPGEARAIGPAVLWLEPVEGTPAVSFPQGVKYTLKQKNRTFIPHLLIVPVGGVVSFPNADPFFHNVFSLYNGKRFDLGLYEAGSSRDVTFTREGASYIFCNIHPEMSAVVIALPTPLYSVADGSGMFAIRGVSPGEYRVHLWVEGVAQQAADRLTRDIHVAQSSVNVGDLPIPLPERTGEGHLNKFNAPYDKSPAPPY